MFRVSLFGMFLNIFRKWLLVELVRVFGRLSHRFWLSRSGRLSYSKKSAVSSIGISGSVAWQKAMGKQKSVRAKELVHKANSKRTAKRFCPRTFLKCVVKPDAIKCRREIKWASCCDGSNMPGYVWRILDEVYGVRSQHVFGIWSKLCEHAAVWDTTGWKEKKSRQWHATVLIFLTLLTCMRWLAYAARGSELDRGAAHFGLLNYDTKHLFLDRLLSCCLDW